MALRRMPNGEYVNVPDDITPEGLQRVMARFKAPSASVPATARRQADPAYVRQREDQAEVERMAGEMAAPTRIPVIGNVLSAVDSAAHAASFGLDDLASAGLNAVTQGGVRAIQEGDIGEVGRTFRNSRAAQKQYRAQQSAERPVENIVGAVIGAVRNPIGAETGVAKLAAKGGDALRKAGPVGAQVVSQAERLASAVQATRTGRTVGKVANSGVGRAARAGFNQGAAASIVDTGDVGNALNEGVLGAAMGGAAGAVVGGGMKAFDKAVRSRSGAQAKNVAYERAARLLDRSENPKTQKPYTPEEVAREVRATDAAGGSAIVADLLPEGRADLSYFAKQPGNPAASRLINDAERRMGEARTRFEDKVRRMFGTPDAYETAKATEAGRKAAGKAMYSPDVMNQQLRWNDELDELWKLPYVQDVIPAAEKAMRSDPNAPSLRQLAFPKSTDPNGTMRQVPSLGMIQYITQALDDKIGNAVQNADRNQARIYSQINRAIKEQVAKESPEFAAAVAVQKDAFERLNSVELGENILSALNSRSPTAARKLLDDLQEAKVKPDDVRMAFADALMHMKVTGDGNPVRQLRSVMQRKDQRAVLAKMFGSYKSLNEFERFIQREMRSLDTDKMVASGRQMPSDQLREPGVGDDREAVADIGKSVLQGFAFGGSFGGASRGLRAVETQAKKLSPAAQAELAKILSGKGGDLRAGIDASKLDATERARLARIAAELAGKAPIAAVGGYSER